MGAGKTSVGREIERLAGYHFVDLDEVIVRAAGRSIPEIFDQQGERAFRDFEATILGELAITRPAVIATGGGVVGRPENWKSMRRLGPVVFLNVGWPRLVERLAESSGRPLARAEHGWEPIRSLWESRLELYQQADIIVNAEQGDAESVARRVLKAVTEWSCRCPKK